MKESGEGDGRSDEDGGGRGGGAGPARPPPPSCSHPSRHPRSEGGTVDDVVMDCVSGFLPKQDL